MIKIAQLRTYPALKDQLRKSLRAIGYPTDDWVRVMLYRDAFAHIRELGPEKLDVMEIRVASSGSVNSPSAPICPRNIPASISAARRWTGNST